MPHNAESDLLRAKCRDLGIDLVQNRDQAAHQIFPTPSERARHGLRQHRYSRADKQHDGRETDQNVERVKHGGWVRREGVFYRVTTPIISTRVKTKRPLAC